MKKNILVLLVLVVSNFSFSQTDSTDLNIYMTDPILVDEMDSLMYNAIDYGELYFECDISDTVYFNGVNIEISYTSNDQTLYKGVFMKADLLTNNQLDSNWHLIMDLGKLEKQVVYTISFSTRDINGLLGPIITKQFMYAGN